MLKDRGEQDVSDFLGEGLRRVVGRIGRELRMQRFGAEPNEKGEGRIGSRRHIHYGIR